MRVPYVSGQGGGHPFAIFVISAQSAVRRERASATGSGSLHGGQSRFAGHRAERDHEGTTVGQADVREVQDHPPPWRGARDLPEPPPQAAAGLAAAWHESQESTSR